jgi:hypothetical protein
VTRRTRFPHRRVGNRVHFRDALDTWHDCAVGKPAAKGDFVAAIDILESVPDERTDVVLGGIARHWAANQGIELHRTQPVHHIEAPGIEIDL